MSQNPAEVLAAPAPNGEALALGDWRVQPLLNRVARNGAEVKLEPRVMQVLACLLRARGEPVTRDALVQAVWGHPHVTDDALNRTVSKLRRVITDELGCDAQIETLAKVGYRLVCGPAAAAPGPQPVAAARRPAWHIALGIGALALVLVVAADWMGWLRSTPGEGRLVPVTSLPGHEIEATLSPDGSHVAFAWLPRPGAGWDIQVMALESESLHAVTDHPADDYRPAWSPSGTQIAFLRQFPDRHCEVHLVAPVGGATRKVADCYWDEDILAWTPDGAGLVLRAPGQAGLSLLTLADGSTRPLTTPPPEALGDTYPAVSPDGTKLAFTRWRAYGVGDLHVVDFSGGKPVRLTFDNLKLHGMTWEPDGRHLVYSSNRGGGFALWRVSVDGGASQRVPVAARAADTPVMSRDGRRLIYEEWTGQTNVFALETETPGAQAQALTTTTRWDWNPQVSPDDTRIAFISDRTGSAELWVADRDGRNALRLTGFGGPYTGGPAWSPDGSTIVFDTPAVDGNFDLYLVPAAGGAPQRFTTDAAEDRFGHFSADGREVYFSSRRGGEWQIWKKPVAGGPETQVTKGGGYFAMPAADGSLYFSRIEQAGLWRLAPGAAEPEALPVKISPLDCANWHLRGNRLWFIERGEREAAFLARHDLARGTTERLVSLPQLAYKSGLSVSSNGRAYYAHVVRSETDLVMMVREP